MIVMIVPIFYRVWVANTQLIQSMKECKHPKAEALELYHKYAGNKKKYLKRMISYALLFLIGVGIVLVGKDFLPNEGYVFIPLLVAIFVGVLGAASNFNKYSVSNEYVKALQIGYPEID